MKEFVEKLIGRLEEESKKWLDLWNDTRKRKGIYDYYADGMNDAFDEAINIVNHLAEEYKGGWIEKILEAKKNCSEDSNCSECPFGQIEDRCILNELQIESDNNGWIPCSERLPENNKVVLCWVVSTTIASGNTYIIGSCDRGFWFLQTYEIGHHHFPVKDYEVIAWQPLPDPYIPKQEEQKG